ncbi:hypothetical protein Hesp01_20920 [Herbidospora sp. NBRC 101105]|nr:hypothetical protein Hesp01_20920 [Herbidospora sp. NBRC 101105]
MLATVKVGQGEEVSSACGGVSGSPPAAQKEPPATARNMAEPINVRTSTRVYKGFPAVAGSCAIPTIAIKYFAGSDLVSLGE